MTLVLKVKDSNLSVAGFQKETKEGKPYISFVIQRSYKVGENEFKNENINLFANDLLRVSALCDEAYKQSLKLNKPEIEEEPKKEETRQEVDPFDDNIPF